MNKWPLVVFWVLLGASCTSLDFFAYEENTGLYVIERPSGYRSTRFGSELASSHTGSTDFLAVSAGSGYGTIVYKLSEDGKLIYVDDRWNSHLFGNDEAEEANDLETASALAGLPIFGEDQGGCFAIGEPGGDRVSILCEEGEALTRIMGDEDSRFGSLLAAVRSEGSDSWLLAVAGEGAGQVFSSAGNLSNNASYPFVPMGDDGDSRAPIHAMDAGRASERVMVAVSAPTDTDGPLGTHLFIQDAPDSSTYVQVACLERPSDPGFGGVLAFGDLDMDGTDELLIAAAGAPKRQQAVYVYDVGGLIPEKIDPYGSISPCVTPTPLSVLVPENGDIDVDCEAVCDFGVTLAVGDIATDDSGPEIAVGAPGARVENKGEAGAVYLYRGQEAFEGEAKLVGQVADSHPQSGHRFGGGLTIAPMAGRNELIVGATGAGQAIIAYCTGVGEDLLSGADTPTDADGSLVSTRCRPEN